MAAIVFPVGPSIGTLYPADPGTSGVTQYQWDGAKWNAVYSSVSLGSPNQGAYNNYQWPALDGTVGQQLTTDGTGNLSWSVTSTPSIQMVGLTPPFDDTTTVFTLVEAGGSTPFIPDPVSNLIVFLGGVPQIPGIAYSVTPGTSTITFADPPLTGTTFYAISNIVV